MAVSAGTLAGRVVKFVSTSKEVKPGALSVVSFEGWEAISRPYQFDLEFVSPIPNLDESDILDHSATLVLKQAFRMGEGGRIAYRAVKYQGALSSFEYCQVAKAATGGGAKTDWILYRATLVPHLWRLSVNVRSRVFVDKNVPQIVEEVLWDNKFLPDQFEFRMERDVYRKREFVLQYQESDLNFVSRLLEEEGIFFWFDHDGDEEKIIFADSTNGYGTVQGTDTVPFLPQQIARGGGSAYGGGYSWTDPEVMFKFRARKRVVPMGVTVQDYYYMTPGANLRANLSTGKEGFGEYYEFGDHHITDKEAKRIANARAEEIRTRRRVFHGTGVVKSFHPGLMFNLTGHPRDDFNQPYLVTEVYHRAEQSMSLGSFQNPTASYENEIVCIPAIESYRPPLLTPKPRVAGFLQASVDAAGDGKYAEIDDQGRYKVKLKLDLTDAEKGTASCWIPMAQPYAGQDYGLHYPLHKGVDVLLTFANGDPDRPVIAGSLPNPIMKSPVTANNQTQAVLRTGGGNEIRIEDIDSGQYVRLFSPTATTFLSLGAPHEAGNASAAAPAEDSAVEKAVDLALGAGAAAASAYNLVTSIKGAMKAEGAAGKGFGLLDVKAKADTAAGTISSFAADVAGVESGAQPPSEPEGVVLASQAGISVNSGHGIHLTAGGKDHPEGSGFLGKSISWLERHSKIVGNAGLVLGAVAADVASLYGVGTAALKAHTVSHGEGKWAEGGIALTAPATTSMVSGKDAIVGAKETASIISGKALNLQSVQKVGITGLLSVAMNSWGKVEVVSLLSNVKIQAKKVGNVEIEAKKAVKVLAHKADVAVQAESTDVTAVAKKNVKVTAEEESLFAAAKKNVSIESTAEGVIQLKTGDSMIVMKKDGITIVSPTINIVTKDHKAQLDLSDKESVPFLGQSKGAMSLKGKEEVELGSASTLVIGGKNVIKVETQNLNEKGAKEINRANSKEA